MNARSALHFCRHVATFMFGHAARRGELREKQSNTRAEDRSQRIVRDAARIAIKIARNRGNYSDTTPHAVRRFLSPSMEKLNDLQK